MSKMRPLSDAEREDLVAYLDGETIGEAKRTIEAKISLDPRWRAEAESLKRTWDMLDYLPRQEPSPDFTQRTLSRLEPMPKPVGKPGGVVRLRFFRPVRVTVAASWAAALLMAVLGGYSLTRSWWPHGPGEAELVRDLRIIENKRYYNAVDDIRFLRKLDDPELFGEGANGG
jgi:anti-sigma factor RsiW